MKLLQDLEQRQRDGRPITVAVVGAGQMGRGLVNGLAEIVGMEARMVVDIDLVRARQALVTAGVAESRIEECDNSSAAAKALADGRWVVSRHSRAIPETGVDAVVEATGVPSVGAAVALETIRRRQHLVLLNVETDVTVGPLLRHWAELAGVVYTVSAGDEPGATVDLIGFARSLGFHVVAAGKGKNNPLDFYATPASVAEEAASKGASAHMFCSFVDGSKTMMEMTAVANAAGLTPELPGMRGPHLTADELADYYRLRDQGGQLERSGVVDYVHGIAPGVFVVVTTTNPVIAEDMEYLKVGPGPNWALYRPYHLANLETPHSVARAVLYGEATLQPLDHRYAEVVAVAKQDLPAGSCLDGIGGYTVRGLIMAAEDAARDGTVPLGLAEHAVVRSPVGRGAVLAADQVELDRTQLIVQLRQLQEWWLA